MLESDGCCNSSTKREASAVLKRYSIVPDQLQVYQGIFAVRAEILFALSQFPAARILKSHVETATVQRLGLRKPDCFANHSRQISWTKIEESAVTGHAAHFGSLA